MSEGRGLQEDVKEKPSLELCNSLQVYENIILMSFSMNLWITLMAFRKLQFAGTHKKHAGLSNSETFLSFKYVRLSGRHIISCTGVFAQTDELKH